MGENNTLHSQAIQFKWFDRVGFNKDSTAISDELLENWAINNEELEKIIHLAKEIIDSKTTLVLAKTEPKNALFNKELTIFTNMQMGSNPTDIDKWLALLVGNILHTDNEEERVFFNGKLDNPENLFEMIRNWNYSNSASAPVWARKYFTGIKMQKSHNINLISLNLLRLNFSYSDLKNIDMYHSNLFGTKFNNCVFEHINMSNATLIGARFDNIQIIGSMLEIGFSRIADDILIPINMANCLLNIDSKMHTFYINCGSEISYIRYHTLKFVSETHEIFDTLRGLLVFGLEKKLFDIKEIKSWFEYGDDKTKEEFEKLINKLGKGLVALE